MNTTTTTTLLASTLLAGAAAAFPIGTDFADLPNCDPLSGPKESVELGFMPPFPVECSVTADSNQTLLAACPTSDDPTVPDSIVRMTNTSGRAYSDVWYVGEFGSGFSNFDGTVNGMEAFRIDSVGGNRPLIFESMTPDGIFEVGELWQFIVQDYGNAAGLPAHGFSSVGVPSGGLPGGSTSTASIVAVPVPTPGAAALFTLAAGALGRRRRA